MDLSKLLNMDFVSNTGTLKNLTYQVGTEGYGHKTYDNLKVKVEGANKLSSLYSATIGQELNRGPLGYLWIDAAVHLKEIKRGM